MGSQRNIFPPAIFLNLGLVLIATLFLIAYSSAYAVPLSSRADEGGDGDDERIQILRRSGAADENGGMEDALKYLEELDKYYAQVARPRGMFSFFLPPSYFVQMKKTPVSEETDDDNELPAGETPKKVVYAKRLENFSNIQGADGRLSHMARPRFGKRSDLSLNKMAKLLRTSVPVEMIYRGL